MTQNKQIVVDVLPDGEIRVETQGFKGPDCIKESAFLKEALGNEMCRQLTPAHYETAEQSTKAWLPLCG